MPNHHPTGLEATCWNDLSNPHTPGWARELLEIPGVEKVRKLNDQSVVAVDTTLRHSENGIVQPNPELMPALNGRDEWDIHQVKMHDGDGLTHFRIELKPSRTG